MCRYIILHALLYLEFNLPSNVECALQLERVNWRNFISKPRIREELDESF
jgi:hypothetical protein